MKTFVFVGLSISIFLSLTLTSAEEEAADAPALTCVVIGDTACQRMCTMLGRIYGAPATPAKCDTDNNCDCSMVLHKYLDDLWRDKFTSTDFLETVQSDEQRYRAIVKVMKQPYQTREQTRRNLEPLFAAEDFARIQPNDNVTEHMTKTDAAGKETLDLDAVRSFVSQSLQSDPLQLPSDFCYKNRLREALRKAPNDDIAQYIIHDVRRSKNAVLNDIADEFLNEKQITEETYLDEDEDNFTDILDLYIVTEYIDPTPIPNPKTDDQNDATVSPWEIPGLDVDSIKAFTTGYECWKKDEENKVCKLKAKWGDMQLTWIKGKTEVEINVDEDGDMSQTWHLDDGVEISLMKSSEGEIHQLWTFAPDSRFQYVKNGDEVKEEWSNDKKNEEALTKYKQVIDSWCEKNSIFLEREFCVIY